MTYVCIGCRKPYIENNPDTRTHSGGICPRCWYMHTRVRLFKRVPYEPIKMSGKTTQLCGLVTQLRG